MKLKIKITKEILQKSMYCGLDNIKEYNQNCAIALAVRDIFPDACVSRITIQPFHYNMKDYLRHDTWNQLIDLPYEAQKFITKFDELKQEENYELRLNLPELEFEIDVPECVIELINIEDIHQSKTLELV